MSSFCLSAAVLLSILSALQVAPSPICVEADVPKFFCGPKMVEALNQSCGEYPTLQSEPAIPEATSTNTQENEEGITDMCCKKPCTLNFLVNNFCADIHPHFKPCPKSNHIQQDRDSTQVTTAAVIDEYAASEPVQERRKHPDLDAKSAAMPRKAVITVENEIHRENRVVVEVDRSDEIIHDIPPYIQRKREGFPKNSSRKFKKYWPSN